MVLHRIAIRQRIFKPNTGSTQDYGYDDNGNMSANADKRISAIAYNYLNLQEDVSMSGSTGSMTYAYDAVGSKLQQQVFAGSTLESTTDYIGEAVILGPGRTQEIHAGDSLTLQVHGKYADENGQQVNVGSYVTQAAKGRLVESLSELAGSLQRSGTGNPIALLNLADILASDLQHKKAPEAYMLYALYDADSNRYEVGKQVLTKNAANQHEILEKTCIFHRTAIWNL